MHEGLVHCEDSPREVPLGGPVVDVVRYCLKGLPVGKDGDQVHPRVDKVDPVGAVPPAVVLIEHHDLQASPAPRERMPGRER